MISRMGRSGKRGCAKAVVDSQNFENKLLKAYIRDWPAEGEGGSSTT